MDFCLFVFVWVLFVLNYDRRAKDIKRLQWACSRGNSSPDLLLHTMCSFQHPCPSNRRLSWIYQGSCILSLFKHCVMACSSGRLQVQHTGGSWGKKRLFLSCFYLGPVEVLYKFMMWCWGVKCLPISNQTLLSLLRSDPARCLVKRSLKIYFVCCSTAWVTGVNSFAFGIMRVLWLKNDNIEKKGTLGRFLLARVSMFLCLWFHNIWSEHPICHKGEGNE